MQSGVGPFGIKTSDQYLRYGPSYGQMLANPGEYRTPAQSHARIVDKYYGPGSYVSSMSGGAAAGAGVGALFAAPTAETAAPITVPIGALIGAGIGWYDEYSGKGSYQRERVVNDLITHHGGSAPAYHSAGAADEMGDVIMSNRELVEFINSGDVATGESVTSFDIKSYTVNPVDAVFHHLRKTAQLYEQFEFLGLMFEFVPTYGEGGENQLGTIGMAASYDPGHSRTFTGMEDLVRFKGSVTTKPSVPMLFGVECDPSKRAVKTMYCRDNVTRTKDFTDLCTFYVATEGLPKKAQVGQLWVTYTVKLRNLKPSDVLDIPQPVRRHGIRWSGSASSFTGDVVSGEANSGALLSVKSGSGTTHSCVVELSDLCQKDSVWLICVKLGASSAQTSPYPQINVAEADLVGLEFVKISNNDSSGNWLKSSDVVNDFSYLILFKVRVVGGSPSFKISATNAFSSAFSAMVTINEAEVANHGANEIRIY